MKKLLKISAFIISASVVFTLCACGKNDNPTGTTAAGTTAESTAGTTAVVAADAKIDITAAHPAESENTKTASGDIDLGDGIILPEDGRIYFGDQNKTTEASKDSKTEKTTAAGQKATTKAAAKTTKVPAKTTAKADTKTATKAYVTPGTPTTQKTPATEKQTAKPEATTRKQADKTEAATQNIAEKEKTTTSTPVSPQDATGWGDIKWN